MYELGVGKKRNGSISKGDRDITNANVMNPNAVRCSPITAHRPINFFEVTVAPPAGGHLQ
jgi:hypothetical protein